MSFSKGTPAGPPDMRPGPGYAECIPAPQEASWEAPPCDSENHCSKRRANVTCLRMSPNEPTVTTVNILLEPPRGVSGPSARRTSPPSPDMRREKDEHGKTTQPSSCLLPALPCSWITVPTFRLHATQSFTLNVATQSQGQVWYAF